MPKLKLRITGYYVRRPCCRRDIRVGLLVGHRHIEVLRVAVERRPAPEVLSREVNRNLRKADLRDPPFGEVVTELQVLQPDVRYVLQIARVDVDRTGVHRTVVAHVARQIGIRALLGPIVLQMPRRNLVVGTVVHAPEKALVAGEPLLPAHAVEQRREEKSRSSRH